MIKVLQVGKFYPPDTGGIESTIYEITEGLNKRGMVCDVLCSNNKNNYSEEFIQKDTYSYKVFRVKSLGKKFSTSIAPQMITKLREIIKYYDIIHIHHPDPMAALALFLSNHKKKKVFLHWHSDIVKQRFLLPFYLPLLRWLQKRADIIIATTEKYIQESEQLKDFKEKCIAIPLGVNKSNFLIDQKKINEIKKKYKNKKIIFSLGRFVYYKGFEYLIEASKYLPYDYVVLIGGDGPLKDKYLDIISKNKLSEKVYLLGKISQEDLGNYYSACNIFCLPSITKSEAFGLVIVEAMSFGKPIIATKIKGSGVDWVNQHKLTGINIEVKSSKAIAEAIVHVLENKSIYEFYSRNALERYHNEFTTDKMVERIFKLFYRMIE